MVEKSRVASRGNYLFSVSLHASGWSGGDGILYGLFDCEFTLLVSSLRVDERDYVFDWLFSEIR
jgi:hypothetical protein